MIAQDMLSGMPHLHLLGTGAAATAAHRHTTMLAFSDQHDLFLVDCGGDVIQRILAAGFTPDQITGLMLTHEHPDHVAGFPLFMEKIWLHGRREPIPIYGPAPALDQAQRCFATFNTTNWIGMPDMQWHEVALAPETLVLENEHWQIHATPVKHWVPTMGLRVHSKVSQQTVVYSCDTAPCDAVLDLAKEAHILVHEATELRTSTDGHTSVIDAARIAQQTGVAQLILVHLPAHVPEDVLAEAQTYFPNTVLGNELEKFGF